LRTYPAWLLALTSLCLAGCQPGTPASPPPSATAPALATPAPASDASPDPLQGPIEMEIGGQTLTVDQVVTGLLCAGEWSGTVYVPADVQVAPWEDRPNFLEGCDLTIAPNTVVYVAAHDDAAYYNGCMCHTGDIGEP